MLESILNVFRGLLAPVIAGVVAYIAYQQHKTNRDKLRLDLFDKRHKIFQSLMSLLGRIAQQGDVEHEQLTLFLRETADAHFLFDKGISDYLDTIYKNAVQLHSYEHSIKTARSPAALLEKRGRLFDWFTAQFEVSRKNFGKYLGFRQSTILSGGRTMNWKRGFKRITFVLSLLAFTFWVAFGIIEGYILDGVVDALWLGPLIGLAFFAGIWVIYCIGGYIVKGFRGDEPKDEQKE